MNDFAIDIVVVMHQNVSQSGAARDLLSEVLSIDPEIREQEKRITIGQSRCLALAGGKLAAKVLIDIDRAHDDALQILGDQPQFSAYEFMTKHRSAASGNPFSCGKGP